MLVMRCRHGDTEKEKEGKLMKLWHFENSHLCKLRGTKYYMCYKETVSVRGTFPSLLCKKLWLKAEKILLIWFTIMFKLSSLQEIFLHNILVWLHLCRNINESDTNSGTWQRNTLWKHTVRQSDNRQEFGTLWQLLHLKMTLPAFFMSNSNSKSQTRNQAKHNIRS